jgi:hypothetical protein
LSASSFRPSLPTGKKDRFLGVHFESVAVLAALFRDFGTTSTLLSTTT